MISAILLAQWRSMRTFRLSARPATAIFSSITGVLFYGFWAVIAYAAEAFFANLENAHYFPLVLTSGLLLVMLYWQVTPVITASMGASLDLKKLLSYPIPHAKLFFVEILLRLTTCAEMLLILFGVFLGLSRARPAAIPGAFTAIALFILFNLLLSAGIRNLLERILLRKRLRELLVFLLLAISILPQFLLNKGFFHRASAYQDTVPDIVWFPWSATSHMLLGRDLPLSAAVLLASIAAVFFFSRWQFEKSLRFEDSGSSKAETLAPQTLAPASRFEGLFRLPGRLLPDPTAAIMEKELRSLIRTPSFRLIFIMGAAFGLVIWLPHLLRGGANQHGFLADNVVTFAALYGVLILGQVTYFNCFGLERSAVQVWFSIPVPIVRTLIAKNLVAIVFICVQIVFVSLTALLFRIQLTPLRFLETACVSLIAAVYLISFGNIASVRLPRLMNPDKINQGGSTKAMNALILLCFPVVLLPIGLAYWARSVFDSEPVFFLLLALAAIFGAVLYWVAITSAAGMANQRREKILTDLSRGEGPLSVT